MFLKLFMEILENQIRNLRKKVNTKLILSI